jgi:hypothetical protein
VRFKFGHTAGGRRRFLALLAVAAAAPLPTGARAQTLPAITVYKSPSCGCCGAWVEHLTQSGFHVNVVNERDVTPEKRYFGVPERLYSCHTARVDGYTIEGHVPADDIKRLLVERPAVAGLSVPGMPHGSPGMETGRTDHYEVISFTDDGATSVFSSY